MNKHIELVEKWLADNNSVSLEELKANRYAAYAAYDAARAAYEAAYAAYDAAYAADYDAYYARTSYFNASDAAYYVKEYKELTK